MTVLGSVWNDRQGSILLEARWGQPHRQRPQAGVKKECMGQPGRLPLPLILHVQLGRTQKIPFEKGEYPSQAQCRIWGRPQGWQWKRGGAPLKSWRGFVETVGHGRQHLPVKRGREVIPQGYRGKVRWADRREKGEGRGRSPLASSMVSLDLNKTFSLKNKVGVRMERDDFYPWFKGHRGKEITTIGRRPTEAAYTLYLAGQS